jgi:hypothetical protein
MEEGSIVPPSGPV